MRSKYFGLLILPALAFAARPARAENTGFALERFDPADPGSHWFVGESLDYRGLSRPAVGIVADYASKPLVAYDKNGDLAASIVEKQTVAHLGASLVLRNRFRVAVDLPLQLQATGTTTQLGADVAPAPASSFALGDLRLGLDARIFGRNNGPFVAALGLHVHVPTGDQASYASDGAVRVVPRVMVAGKAKAFEWSGRVNFNVRDLPAYAGTSLGSEVGIVATAGLRTAGGKLLVGPEIYGSTALTDAALGAHASPLEALLGAHYTLGSAWHVGAGVGTGLTSGYGTPAYRGVFSLAWAPQPKDSDGDGIHDGEDACVSVKGVESDNPLKNGCPPDKDEDGIPDAVDACVDVKGIATADPHTNGCPDKDGDSVRDDEDACVDVAGAKTSDPKTNGCPDKDQDGIPDAVDACVDVKGIPSADPKLNGCPADRDGDGIPDVDDACPDQKGTKNADPKLNGCYVDPDRDKDGIENEKDACPDNAGPADPKPEKNGCPLVVLRGEKIEILEQVQFKTGSSEILKASDELLNKVSAIFKEHAEIKKVLVEGHTDNKGNKAANQKLSAARAASVRAWLTKHGVEAKRLESKGFGQETPIATNDTDEGRAKNRRVEFKILESGKAGAVVPVKPAEQKPKAEEKKADKPKAEEKKADKPKAPAKSAPKKK